MTDKQIREAAEYLGENALWLIKQILIKHDAAILEASKEAIEAAVKAEREECAKLAWDKFGMAGRHIAGAIRARSQS